MVNPDAGSRRTAELRLFGVLGISWQVAVVLAALASSLALGWPGAALPWSMLALPHAIALTVVSVALFVSLPKQRWPTSGHARVPPGPLMIAGWPTLLFASLVSIRDSAAHAGARASPKEERTAFVRLLRVPQRLGAQFWFWGSAAMWVDALILGDALSWPRTRSVLLALLWSALLVPLAAVIVGFATRILRPECLAAPHRVRRFASQSDLRRQMTLHATLVGLSIVLTPLLCAALFHGQSTTHALPLAPLAFAAVILCAGVLTASIFVARSVHRDVIRATARIRAVVRRKSLRRAVEGSFTTREARELVASVDRLVGRITEANISRYVAIEKAKEADRLKSQFLANMSHDLRSPLNAVLGFSELLLSGIDGDLAPEQREMLTVILDSGRGLLREIDDILDTAKIEAGRLHIGLQPTPLATIVTRAIADAKKKQTNAAGETTEIDYRIRIAAGLPPGVCDPYRTTQALTNVLLFAAEGAPAPVVGLDVELRSTRGTPALYIDVSTGHHPATPEDLARARSGFFRIPGHKGLGLGLPLAASILELQGGAFDIEERGEGMAFRMQIPAVRRVRATPAHIEVRQRPDSGPHRHEP